MHAALLVVNYYVYSNIYVYHIYHKRKRKGAHSQTQENKQVPVYKYSDRRRRESSFRFESVLSLSISTFGSLSPTAPVFSYINWVMATSARYLGSHFLSSANTFWPLSDLWIIVSSHTLDRHEEKSYNTIDLAASVRFIQQHS